MGGGGGEGNGREMVAAEVAALQGHEAGWSAKSKKRKEEKKRVAQDSTKRFEECTTKSIAAG
ncbi:hypothetical protein FS842_007520 [Serendipita sp. 407]|nr:hypothetical protein FS842_007520 [Serendipita sp. 407]